MAGSTGDGARVGVVGAVVIAGVAGEMSAVLVGGRVEVVPAVPVCGFRWSTVTAMSLPPMSRWKYFGPLSSTLYGPL